MQKVIRYVLTVQLVNTVRIASVWVKWSPFPLVCLEVLQTSWVHSESLVQVVTWVHHARSAPPPEVLIVCGYLFFLFLGLDDLGMLHLHVQVQGW